MPGTQPQVVWDAVLGAHSETISDGNTEEAGCWPYFCQTVPMFKLSPLVQGLEALFSPLRFQANIVQGVDVCF